MRKVNKAKGLRTRAFSLIELMVAMLVFATCLLAAFGIFATAAKASSQAGYTLLAAEVAQKEIEYLKNLDWDELENFSSYAVSNPDKYYRTTTLDVRNNGVQNTINFSSTPMVSACSTDDYGNVDAVSIKVVVQYDFGSGRVKETDGYNKSVELETIVCKPE